MTAVILAFVAGIGAAALTARFHHTWHVADLPAPIPACAIPTGGGSVCNRPGTIPVIDITDRRALFVCPTHHIDGRARGWWTS